MRQQTNLLQYFLDAWDPTNQVFQIRGKSIPLNIVDIYFLTGLSRHGAPISLSGPAHGGESVRDYIRQYCREGSQPSKDGKINIRESASENQGRKAPLELQQTNVQMKW